MALHLDSFRLGISRCNDRDSSQTSTCKEFLELIDFLEDAHKFIKRMKNSSSCDYNLTRVSLISLSVCLCLLYLASDHFTGFTKFKPDNTLSWKKSGLLVFFQGKSWKLSRKTNRWPILAAERTEKNLHWAKAAHWRCTFNLQSKHSSANIHKCFLMFLMKIPTLLTA